MGINLSGFVKGLASQDPVGHYMKTKEFELRKRQADNAQQEFEWRKQEQADKQAYADASSEAMGKIGTQQFQQANTNNLDDGVASTDRAALQGLPTEYTRADYYKDIAGKAAKVNPQLGFEFLDKQRAEEKRNHETKFLSAFARYKDSGDPTDLVAVFNDLGGIYNKDKRFNDGKYIGFSAVPVREGNAGAEGIPLANAGTPEANASVTKPALAFSMLDTNTGKSAQHLLTSEDDMVGAYYKAIAQLYPEELAKYTDHMDKIKTRNMQDRRAASDEKRADAQEKRANVEADRQYAQQLFQNGQLAQGNRRLDIMERQALATNAAKEGKAALGWRGMDLKERDEYMKNNSGRWSIPTGNGDASYSEHPQGRALFSALADTMGAEQALNIMSGAMADINKKAALVPGAVDDKGYIDPRAKAHAADFVYADALAKLAAARQQQQQPPSGAAPSGGVPAPSPRQRPSAPPAAAPVENGVIDVTKDPALSMLTTQLKSINKQDASPENVQKIMALGEARNKRLQQLQEKYGRLTKLKTE